MKVDLGRFVETFVEEAREHVSTLEAGLLQLRRADGDAELLAALFRAVHSVKGSSGMFGFTDVSSFAHALEGVLSRLRDGRLAPSAPTVDLLLRCSDLLGELVSAAEQGAVAPPGKVELEKRLEALVAGTAESGDGVARPGAPGDASLRCRVRARPTEAGEAARDALELWGRLRALGEVQRLEAELPAAGAHSSPGWVAELRATAAEGALRAALADTDWELEITAAVDVAVHPASRAGLSEASIRVGTGKVDELVNLAGELSIAQSVVTRAAQAVEGEAAAPLAEAVAVAARNARDLQERVLAMRMEPLERLFARMPRLVHDVAAACGKEVELRCAGGETELDRGVIERVSDPLVHLIRNAIDHGIETPSERRALGKPAAGVITLSARHEAGNVHIEIADDGRGLDRAAITARAVALGLVREEEALTEEQASALIFHPGLSTASTVTDVSGRGIGADVVRRNVEALNGSVTVSSAPGMGTRFLLKLPLTLALLDGIQLRVGKRRYIVPLLAVVECFRPAPEQLHCVAGGEELVRLHGDPLPLLGLGRLLGADAGQTARDGVVVVIASDGFRFGLLVDELLDPAQVVIKSLEANYRRVEGILGATILGDGSVSLILDVGGLARLARRTRAADAPNHLSLAATT